MRGFMARARVSPHAAGHRTSGLDDISFVLGTDTLRRLHRQISAWLLSGKGVAMSVTCQDGQMETD
jgi:hypothetical protein